MSSATKNDPQYADLTAKVVLQAKDVLFRVQEWNLKTFCGFFRDMASVCTDDISSAAPIESEVSPKVLRYFLQIIYTGEKPAWTDTAALDSVVPKIQCFRLAQRWDCDLVRTMVWAWIDACIKANPWETFIAASTIDEVTITRLCLKAFAPSKVNQALCWWRGDLMLSVFAGIAPAYLAELYRVAQEVPRVGLKENTASNTAGISFGGPRVDYNPDWTEVAKRFFQE